jgi:hypothetical protein
MTSSETPTESSQIVLPDLWNSPTVPLGMIENEPIEVYHATRAISKSKLDDFCPPEGRPSYFYRKHILGLVREHKSKVFELGSAAHALILEGSAAFNERYAVDRPWGRKKIEREAKAAYVAEAKAKNKKWLERAEGETVWRMSQAAQSNAVARELLRCGKPEVTWRIKTPSFLVQCRTDWWVESASPELAALVPFIEEGEPVFADLKTCNTLAEDGYASLHKNVRDYGYHKQHAFYREVIGAVRKAKGLRAPRAMLIIGVEKAEPCECGVYYVEPGDVDMATEQIVSSLGLLAQCFANNSWPGVPQNEAIPVGLKPWDKKKAEAAMLTESTARMALAEKGAA